MVRIIANKLLSYSTATFRALGLQQFPKFVLLGRWSEINMQVVGSSKFSQFTHDIDSFYEYLSYCDKLALH